MRLRECRRARFREDDFFTNLDMEGIFCKTGHIAPRAPIREPELSTIERELHIDEANRRHGAWASAAERVYGSKRLRRKSESGNPSSWNRFAAYCDRYGVSGVKDAGIWAELDDRTRSGREKGRALVAHRKSTDDADTSGLSNADVVRPLGSCDGNLPFIVNDARSVSAEDKSALPSNSIIVDKRYLVCKRKLSDYL